MTQERRHNCTIDDRFVYREDLVVEMVYEFVDDGHEANP